MNFLPAVPNLALAALAAVAAGIVLLYFLKLRRQPLTVPSTYLWTRTIEDLHVNSLLQRLRNNLLLFLQLLFVALAALALLRPGWQGSDTEGRRMIFLLDASASMAAAADFDEQESRFERAKRMIREQVEAMSGDDEAMLIAFSDRADILQEFTGERGRLLRALEAARVTSRSTNMLEALRAAAGLANPNRTSQAGDVNDVQVADAVPADLWIYSDGRVGNVTDFNLGNLTPSYQKVGLAGIDNLAITAFSAERILEQPDRAQAFAQVTNFGPRTMRGTAALYLDGRLVEAEGIEVPGGESVGLTFALQVVDAGALELRLEQTGGAAIDDGLAVDNVAFAGLAPLREISVLLVSPGNRALELAMQTEATSKLAAVEVRLPDYLQGEEYQERAEQGRDDLIIYDRCTPQAMPATNTFFIGALPPDRWSGGDLTGPVLPIDIDRTHPVMRYLDLFSLRIVEGRSLQTPRGAVNLISADIGPVLALAPREGYQDLVMGFDVVSQGDDGQTYFNTDWPVQRSWPVFVYNLMRHLGGAVDTAGASSIRPGETIPLRLDNRFRTVEVETPAGDRQSLAVGPAGNAPFAATESPGVYRVLPREADSDDRPLALFTVNLFDSRESDLQPADTIELGYEQVEGGTAVVARRSEAWRWVLLIALGVLATEWLIFNRRLL